MTVTAALPPLDVDVVAAAAAEARQAAEAAGVSVDSVHDVEGFEAVRRLFDDVWRPDPGDEPVTRGLLNALVHCGNYCAAAARDGEMLGASMGFLGLQPEPLLHSHITGVLAGGVGRGVGLALKLHQRWWALQQGLRVITWTYDPLVRRNAYFNARKLGALPVEYLVDFYGEMNDVINAGQGSDRLLSRWDLLHRHRPGSDEQTAAPVDLVVPGFDGAPERRPAPTAPGPVAVQVPPDIEQLRGSDPVVAARWRSEVRATLGALMAEGWRVVDVTREGRYLLLPGTLRPVGGNQA